MKKLKQSQLRKEDPKALYPLVANIASFKWIGHKQATTESNRVKATTSKKS